jgi:hypothetical protein
MPVYAMKTGNAAAAGQYEPLPADTYLMRIREAKVTESRFVNEKTGENDLQVELTWEIVKLTTEQAEAGADPKRWVKQWVGFYYGGTKSGPSKFKALIDGLRSQGLLEEFDESSGEFDPDWLIGIEQRVLLTTSGSWNKVVGVSAPLKSKKAAKAEPKRNEPKPVDEREALVANLRQLYKQAKAAGVEELPTKEQIENSNSDQLKAIAATLEEMIAAKNDDGELF